MLTANRISQTNLALVQARNVYKLLNTLRSAPPSNAHALDRMCKELASSGAVLAATLTAKREYSTSSAAGQYDIDPRFLLFEFSHSLLLRRSQVHLVWKLIADIRAGKSACHQVCVCVCTIIAPFSCISYKYKLIVDVVDLLIEYNTGSDDNGGGKDHCGWPATGHAAG